MHAPDRSAGAYWRKTQRLSALLLLAWLLVTVGVGLYGRSLDVRLFGWHLGFWLTAQVSLLVFCVIVWVYALAMDRVDQAYGRDANTND